MQQKISFAIHLSRVCSSTNQEQTDSSTNQDQVNSDHKHAQISCKEAEHDITYEGNQLVSQQSSLHHWFKWL